MAILATARELGKSFSTRPLFDGVCFTLAEGERVGLIGPNGAGKSTLLRILAGADSPDQGELVLRRGLRVGHVAQVPELRPGQTVRGSGTWNPSKPRVTPVEGARPGIGGPS